MLLNGPMTWPECLRKTLANVIPFIIIFHNVVHQKWSGHWHDNNYMIGYSKMPKYKSIACQYYYCASVLGVFNFSPLIAQKLISLSMLVLNVFYIGIYIRVNKRYTYKCSSFRIKCQ